ncbi:dihydrolipoamide acetyltransferase family protein [Pseudoflavonifractor sp. MCC625]|uniref:dihydrolipoamide acetyltransferase family protein n=1 Tax=Pseudoflavonifractor sp. MCC625 TaxID=2592647 RepID=UPI001C0367C3|nr:dihydrolipoamide acetyltransferase family protein [Pseudoflavonifractor sp. MCC625]MBT9683795.1 biotin/lipoyl-binding protein [Pseudoflavonifractor sp. MCC625]
MVTAVKMPKFGLSMEEGTIASWLVQEGDTVQKGDALVEINSEKLTNTAEAPADGIVRKIVLQEDETALCGELICVLADSADEDISSVLSGTVREDLAEYGEQTAAPTISRPVPNEEVKITPKAKKRAEELGLEYAHITGTGIAGAITIADLKKFGRPKAAAVPSTPELNSVQPVPKAEPVLCRTASLIQPIYAGVETGEQVIKMSPMQNAICKSMYTSMSTSAQTTLATEANVQNLVKVYQSIKGKYGAAGIKLSYTAMIIKAVAMALENHPAVRTQMVDEEHIKICEQIDIGVAVDIPAGLIVPVIRKANLKDLRTICVELATLTDKAKTGRLEQTDLGNSVTTITNLGMFGVTYFTPVLNAPESTILGVGAIIRKPVDHNDGIFMEHVMNLSLTHDHRVSNGAPCARYLQEVVEGLQNFRWC